MKVVMKEIEMVAYFDLKGFPHPVRFRIESQDSDQKTVVSIDDVTKVEEDRKAGNLMVRYDCQGVVNGIKRPFEITYETTKYRWFLFKI